MWIRIGQWSATCAGILLCCVLSSSLLSSAQGELIGIYALTRAELLFTAESELDAYKDQYGVTPEYLEALSWMARCGRNAMGSSHTYASETRTLRAAMATTKSKLDSEPHLPTPWARPMRFSPKRQTKKDSPRKRSASSFSAGPLRKYLDPSAAAEESQFAGFGRKPAPPLQVTQYLGPKPPTLASLKGSPVLLFFWAHWCADCKGEVPVIARLRQELLAGRAWS